MECFKNWIKQNRKKAFAASGVAVVVGIPLLNVIEPLAVTLMLLGIIGIVITARSTEKRINSTGSVQTGKTQQEVLKLMIPQWQGILSDCINIVDTTNNPDVFLSRYELMIETLGKLSATETFADFSGSKPSVMLAELTKPQTRQEQTNNFIQRSYDAALASASKLKTEKGKLNRLRKYFDEMERYKNQMPDGSISVLEGLRLKPVNWAAVEAETVKMEHAAKKTSAEQGIVGMKENGIERYAVSTSGDERVCTACASHEGKIYNTADAVIGKNHPPFCESCRCVVLPCFDMPGLVLPWEKED